MLLETLDIKKDDIVIYSQNIFNHEKNFRIIYKDDPKRMPRKITFEDVCRHINEYSPKNLIVYRLLTNITNFEIYTSKYGFQIYINGVTEMIFFDPVYAVQELEEFSHPMDYSQLRFRIQQVGLTTLNRIGDQPNYAEIYCIDLEATEAKFQNDRVFADAIFPAVKGAKQTAAKQEPPKEEKVKEPVKDKKTETAVAPVKEDAVPVKGDAKPVKEIEKPLIKIVSHKAVEVEKLKQENKTSPLIENTPVPASKKEEAGNNEFIEVESGNKFSGLWKKINFDNANLNAVKNPESKNEHAKKVVDSITQPVPETAAKGLKETETSLNKQEEQEGISGIKIISHDISEDKDFDYKEFLKMNFKGTSVDKTKSAHNITEKKAEEKPVIQEVKRSGPVKPETKTTSPFGKFLEEVKTGQNDKKLSRHGEEKASQVLNMFKSATDSNEYVKERSGKQIVLKLDSK